MKRYVAEAIGTYALVFAGTGAIVVDTVSGGQVGLVGIAVAFGLVVATMIYAIGDLSGAHLNPAVSFGAMVARRFSKAEVIPYVLAQCVGAIAASATLKALFPGLNSYGVTLPTLPNAEAVTHAFVFEVILTFFLMFVILGVTAAGKAETPLAGFAIGGVVAFEVFLGGPVCGASMNPARSLGPALISGQTQHLWVYLAAPVLGGVLAAIVTNYLRSEGDEGMDG